LVLSRFFASFFGETKKDVAPESETSFRKTLVRLLIFQQIFDAAIQNVAYFGQKIEVD